MEPLKIASGALTPLIALLAVWIAYQQYRVNRSKLKLDLYEKRYAVFRALMEFISAALREGNLSNNQLFKFLADTSESEYLFRQPVTDYLREVYSKGNELHTLVFRLAGNELPAGEKRNQIAEEEGTVLKWFSKQFDVAKDLFAPYLDFRNIH